MGKKNTSFVGKTGEYQFARELIARHILPLWPSFDAPGFDLIAYNGESSSRIQVKTVKERKYSRKTTRVVDFNCEDPKSKAYKKTSFDYFAFYSVMDNDWWIVPIEEANKRGMTVRPDSPHCKYQKYKNAWHLLEPKDAKKRLE